MAPRKRSSSQGENDFTMSPTGTPVRKKPSSRSNGGTPEPPKAVSSGYDPYAPKINLIDEERVARMHSALAKKERDEQLARRPRRTANQNGITFRGFLLRALIGYVVLSYYFVCPTDKARQYRVCRAIDSTSSHLQSYEPTLRPYFKTAQRKADPYIAQGRTYVDPYVNAVYPYYKKTDDLVRPHAIAFDNAFDNAFEKKLKPTVARFFGASQKATKPYVDVVHSKYRKTLAPSIEWYTREGNKWYAKNVDPKMRLASNKANDYSKVAYKYTAPAYTVAYPFAQKHFTKTLLPAARTSYKTSRRVYVKQVHPRAVVVGRHANAFYRSKILPTLQRFYSVYIAPQVDKITEKIFEYRVKKEKSESVAKVAVVQREILREHDADDLEDFIAELRDDKYAGDSTESVAEAAPSATLSPAERKAQTKEKREALTALHENYEQEIARLGAVERDLLASRLSEIRSNAIEDVPKRFTATLTGLDEEGDKLVGKLQKYFTKVASDEKQDIEDKVNDSEFLSLKASARIQKMSEDALAEIEEYKAGVAKKEALAAAKACEAVTALAAKAQEEVGFGYTWLDDVSARDWTRFHKLASEEKKWHATYDGMRDGSVKHADLVRDDPKEALASVEKEIKGIVGSFDSILSKIKLKGQKELKGEWTGLENEAAKAYDAVGAKVADIVDAVRSSASSIAGAEPTPSNFQQSASSIASVAQASLSAGYASAFEALPHVPTEAIADSFHAATQNVEAVLDQAASSIDSVAQAVVTEVPAALKGVYSMASSLGDAALLSAGENLAAIAGGATEGVAGAASAVSSLGAPHPSFPTVVDTPLAAKASAIIADGAAAAQNFFGDASQSVVRAAGGEPSPTNLQQSATSLANAAAASASSLAAEASRSAQSVASSASSAYSAAASVIGSAAAPHPNFAKSTASAGISQKVASVVAEASSRLHDATRTTPEGFVEHATSLASAASSAVSSLAAHVEL